MSATVCDFTALLIEVRCQPSGDTAYADAGDPGAALVAARSLCDDDFRHLPLQGRSRFCTFHIDGELVAGPVPELEIRNQAGRLS